MRQLKLKTSSFVLVSLLALSLLTGCGKGVFNTCPPIATYSAEQMSKSIAEVDQLPADSEILNMILDYAQLREQLRYCLDSND